MKDYYKILKIDRYATETQIKKAYRELAIKYHPDKSTSINAHKIFTEINEAYQTLSRKESRENYNSVYDYEKIDKRRIYYENPKTTTSDFEEKRKKKQTARRPAYAKKKEEIDLRPYLRSVRIISVLSFLFTFMIILDYFLPKMEFHEIVRSKMTTYRSFSTVVIITDNHEFPLNFTYSKLVNEGDKAIISLSPIFNIQHKLYVDTGIDQYEFWPHYSIYNIFAFFLLVLLITSYIGAFQKSSNSELIFSAGVANVFLSILVMYLIYSS